MCTMYIQYSCNIHLYDNNSSHDALVNFDDESGILPETKTLLNQCCVRGYYEILPDITTYGILVAVRCTYMAVHIKTTDNTVCVITTHSHTFIRPPPIAVRTLKIGPQQAK